MGFELKNISTSSDRKKKNTSSVLQKRDYAFWKPLFKQSERRFLYRTSCAFKSWNSIKGSFRAYQKRTKKKHQIKKF